jgi:hypothetical protein
MPEDYGNTLFLQDQNPGGFFTASRRAWVLGFSSLLLFFSS